MQHTKKGFTLVELSIVLIIIGLIVAGVLAGQDLIDSAKLRSMMKDFDEVHAATKTFQQKYGEIPGDATKASDFFGTACDATPANCNGNGDSYITAAASLVDSEHFRFWQHLTLAELYPGEYSGTTDVNYHAIIGTNIPPSPFEGVGYSTYRTSYTANYTNNPWANRVQPGKETATWANGNSLTVNQAYSIDNKMDDGRPNYGKVLAGYTGCVTGAGASWAYLHTATTVTCNVAVSID